ncbi:hypothetical protein D6764_03325 [Candidatus Woesearchaeota archaeon]|nr:MAG: hypothetical protein D6764_03325 [Candidatus Woesearchaeota archaeon]
MSQEPVVELFVRLIIPDTTAITALNTLKKLGFPLTKLSREDYYQFVLDANADAEAFADRIKKVDVLVNANKHRAETTINSHKEKEDFGILVMNSDDDCAGILKTLKERLGFAEIKSMKRGTYWTFEAEPGADREKLAHDIAKALLYNPHYQEYLLC